MDTLGLDTFAIVVVRCIGSYHGRLQDHVTVPCLV